MLTSEVKRLADLFESWGRGAYPTANDWHQFGRDLRHLQLRVALLELDIDVNVINIAGELARPDTNVVFLSPRRTPRDNSGSAA